MLDSNRRANPFHLMIIAAPIGLELLASLRKLDSEVSDLDHKWETIIDSSHNVV